MQVATPVLERHISESGAIEKSAKLRIAFLDTTRFYGPLMQVHGRIARRLDSERFEAYLLAEPESGSPECLRDVPGLRMWVLPLAGMDSEERGGNKLPALARLMRSAGGTIKAIKLLRKHRIDVLHVGMTGRMLTVGSILSIASVTRLVAHAHQSPKSRRGLSKFLFNAGLGRATMVITVSDFIRDRVIAAGVSPDKVVTVLNTTDLRTFHPDTDGSAIRAEYGISPDDILVVCLARFISEKGQLDLARAMAMVRDSNPRVKALLIGWEDPGRDAAGRTYREQVKQFCEAHGLEGTVILGEARPEASQIMAAADIVAVPSIDDPCPLTVLEGMASGKPIVAYRSGGIPEEVGEGEGAVLVEPGDAQGLASAITEVAGDPQMRLDLGRRSRSRAELEFYESRLAEDVMREYERVTEKPVGVA